MNTLKMNTTIHCGTCGCALKRNKAIKVHASTEKEAILEVRGKIYAWKESLKGKNCKVCQSIIDETINQRGNFQKICYQCEKKVNYLFDDGRCWECTGVDPNNI